MRHETGKGGWFDDEKGYVAAKLAKQRYNDLQKDIRKTERSLGELTAKRATASSRVSVQALEQAIGIKEEMLRRFKAEAEQVQKKAIADFSE